MHLPTGQENDDKQDSNVCSD